MMLALLGTLVADSLQRLNALNRHARLRREPAGRRRVRLLAPWSGPPWLVLLPATSIGGFGGAIARRRVSDTVLRVVVVCFGLGAAAYILFS